MAYTGSYKRSDITLTAHQSKGWEITWKVYFFVLVAISIADPFIVPEQYIELSFILIFTLLSSVIAFIGLFGFAWRERIFVRIFWQLFFFVFLATIGCIFFLPPSPHMQEVMEKLTIGQVAWTFIASLATIPAMIALFLYAFKAKEIWAVAPKSDAKAKK